MNSKSPESARAALRRHARERSDHFHAQLKTLIDVVDGDRLRDRIRELVEALAREFRNLESVSEEVNPYATSGADAR